MNTASLFFARPDFLGRVLRKNQRSPTDGKCPAGFWTARDGQHYRLPSRSIRLHYRYPLHAAIRVEVFERDEFTCQACGWRPQVIPLGYSGRYTVAGRDGAGGYMALDLDHVVPWCRGGSHHPDNLQTLCITCNNDKAARE